jgi:pseudouridylate synthase
VSGVGIAPEVDQAIRRGAPVVALESAVITHGLPHAAAMEAVRRQSEACRKAGAIPAVVAVFDGVLRLGLTIEECETLGARSDAAKVSPWNLAAAAAAPGFGGTTVAATVLAAALARIPVLSTGGIGGVHPGGGEDVSADLTELGRRPVCVVCAGPKSTLDAGATLERLETLGVPVVGWRSSHLAGFLATSTALRLPARVDTITELAALLVRHWELGGAGIVVSQPLTGPIAIPHSDLDHDEGVTASGPDRTPAELSRLQARLGDRVLQANIAILERNAALAGSLAAALSLVASAETRHG